jgi:hypothetical protein
MSYVSEVADLICSLNTNNAVLGAHDYLVISEWEKQEIPLEIVLISPNRKVPLKGRWW